MPEMSFVRVAGSFAKKKKQKWSLASAKLRGFGLKRVVTKFNLKKTELTDNAIKRRNVFAIERTQ